MTEFQPVILQLVIILTIAVINGGCNSILPIKTTTIVKPKLTPSESPNWQNQIVKVAEMEIYLSQLQEQLANELAERIANLAERKIEIAGVLAEQKLAAKEQELLAKPNNSVEDSFPPKEESRLNKSHMALPTTKFVSPTLTRTSQVVNDLIRPTKTGFIFTLGDASFVTNQVELTTNALYYLAKMVLLLQKYPSHPVLITDYIAPTDNRLELIQQRVDMIGKILVEFGVKPQRIIFHRDQKNALNRVTNTTQPACQANHCIEIMLFNGTI